MKNRIKQMISFVRNIFYEVFEEFVIESHINWLNCGNICKRSYEDVCVF